MNTKFKLTTIAFTLTIATLALPATANAFEALKVRNAPLSDPLNVRNFPATSSTVARTYTSGALLSGTGSCKNIITGAPFRIDGPQTKAWKQARMNKPGAWCQIWHEAPNGSGVFKAGWFRASFAKFL